MLRSLQSCRALAALVVVIFHANDSIFAAPKYFGQQPIGWLFEFGPSAIDVFFVLSGFVITYVHAADIGRPGAVVEYLWRRFSRLYFFYWVVLAAVAPVFFLYPQLGYGDERSVDLIARSFFLWPHPAHRSIVIAAWTMTYEVLFYGTFGLLLLNRRLGTAALVAWMAGCLVLPHTGNYLIDFAFSGMHLRFGAGMLACLAVQRMHIGAPRLTTGVGAAIFLLAALNHDLAGPLTPSAVGYCYTVGSAIALAGLVAWERSGYWQSPNWLTHVGDAAYSIYLTHFPVLSVLAKLSKALEIDTFVPGLALFAMHVAAAVVVGLLCHRWLEHPIHVWTKRFFRRERLPEAETVAEPALAQAA